MPVSSASEATTVYLMPSPLALFPGRRAWNTLSTRDVTSYSVGINDNHLFIKQCILPNIYNILFLLLQLK